MKFLDAQNRINENASKIGEILDEAGIEIGGILSPNDARSLRDLAMSLIDDLNQLLVYNLTPT